MGFLTEPTHLLIIAIILLVLFGGKKLPELGKGLGEGLKGFREGIKGVTDPSPASTVQQTAAAAPTSTSTPVESASKKENPLGFKVADYVCRSCQKSS